MPLGSSQGTGFPLSLWGSEGVESRERQGGLCLALPARDPPSAQLSMPHVSPGRHCHLLSSGWTQHYSHPTCVSLQLATE